MRIIHVATAAILLAATAAVQPARAQSPCAAIDFARDITDRFPNARNACLGIEEREGELFAHFRAEIVGVSGDRVRARFRLPNGRYSDTYAFEMDPGDRVHIGGRSYRYRELGRGQELDIYVPHNRWEFHIPEEEEFEVAVMVIVVTPQQADTGTGVAALPRTASSLPSVGLAGLLLTVAGLGMIAIRRRLHG